MARILWAGTRFFGPKLEELGHEVCFVEHEPGQAFSWEDLLFKAGISQSKTHELPDLVVVGDISAPPFVLGLERFPCLTAFYAVDTHIHSWYPGYAQAFDLCLVSLRDHLPLFTEAELPPERVIWSPPYMLDKVTESETASASDKEWDLLFVGKVDPQINPERLTFLRNLKARLSPLASFHWQSGNFHELFPKARLVLNHSISGDLNFRVFEALGCGACLLTPKVRQGQASLFTDKEDLFLFDQSIHDLGNLTALVKTLLENPTLRAQTALSGLEKVNSAHLAIHRAQKLSQVLTGILDGQAGFETAGNIVRRRLERQNEIRNKHLKFIYLLLAESETRPALRKAYLKASGRSY